MDIEWLESIFIGSVHQLATTDVCCLVDGVSEPALCARLGMYLEQRIGHPGEPRYFADVEYNRQQDGKIKTILDDEAHVISVRCDLILHSRGASVQDDNLIAVEMKKSGRPNREKVLDRIRLRALTKESFDGVYSVEGGAHPERVCGYKLGFYVIVDKKKRLLTIEKYVKGQPAGERVIEY